MPRRSRTVKRLDGPRRSHRSRSRHSRSRRSRSRTLRSSSRDSHDSERRVHTPSLRKHRERSRSRHNVSRSPRNTHRHRNTSHDSRAPSRDRALDQILVCLNSIESRLPTSASCRVSTPDKEPQTYLRLISGVKMNTPTGTGDNHEFTLLGTMSLSTKRRKVQGNSTLACGGLIRSCVYCHITATSWNCWPAHMARKLKPLPSTWCSGVASGRRTHALLSSRRVSIWLLLWPEPRFTASVGLSFWLMTSVMA